MKSLDSEEYTVYYTVYFIPYIYGLLYLICQKWVLVKICFTLVKVNHKKVYSAEIELK